MRTKGSRLWRIFDGFRNDEDADQGEFNLKGDASEMLSLYALLRHYVEMTFADRQDELLDERISVHSCCAFLDKIVDMKKGLTSLATADDCLELKDSYWEYLRNHFQAYGDEHMTPKFHLSHCLAKQFFKLK